MNLLKKNKKKNRINLIANSFWFLYNFKSSLIKKLKKDGYEIVLVAPKDEYLKYFSSRGFKVKIWKLNRSSINFISELKSIINLYSICKKNESEINFHFTIKACLYGSLVSKLFLKSKVINNITGLGHLFISNQLKIKFLKPIIFLIFRLCAKQTKTFSIFENEDDLLIFKKHKLISQENAFIIPGSGVDTAFYRNKHISNLSKPNLYYLLFPARIIKEKGIAEVCTAVNKLNKKKYNIQLNIAGLVDKGNRSFIKKEDLLKNYPFLKIKFLGHVKDMKSLYEKCDCVILPSWREGFSKALLESASMECPIITSTSPGCKDIIIHGKTGLLVPIKNPEAIQLAIELYYKNPKLASKMGKASRKRVLENFADKIILRKNINLIKKVLN